MRNHPFLDDIDAVRPFPLITGEALYDVRPPVMQIEDFLPAAGIMGLTAQPGVGKTWLAMEICRAVASGTPFLGKFKTIRGGVLFVGADSSIYDYARQWTRLTRRLAAEEGPEQFDPVRFHDQAEPFLFEDPEAVRRLMATHREFKWGDTTFGHGNLPQRESGFHVMVFDTLSALTNVPENDNTGREMVFRNVRTLAELTDCAIIILHHNAARSEYNDGTGFRGGTSQLGRLDSHINLAPSRRDEYLIGVTYKKFRGIKPGSFSYRMHVSDPAAASLVMTNEPVTIEQKMRGDPLAEAVKRYVAENPGRRACEIRDALWPELKKSDAVSFDSGVKLLNAINNRLNAMLHRGDLARSTNDEGKSVYAAKLPQESLPLKEEPCQSTPTDAPRDTSGTNSARSKGRGRKSPKEAAGRAARSRTGSASRGSKSPRR